MSAAKRPVASLDRRERQINKPPLLNGETILAEAQSVLKYNKMSKRGSGVMGSLYITNFKLAFMMTKIESTSSLNQRMMQLSCRALDDLLVYDESSSDSEYIPLTSISYLTAISTVKQVSKRLTPGKVPSKKYDIIEISCKDFRVVQFDFSLCRDKERAAIINTIYVYSSPTSLYKLFAFDYARGATNAAKASARGRAFHTFRHEKDLELELARLRAQEHWRISRVNEDFNLCKTLPELNLVPSSLDDEALKSVSGFYVDGRFPTLVWHSRETGATLLSSSAPSDQEDVNGGHSQKVIQGICDGLFGTTVKIPIVVDASLLFPSLKELQASYCELFGSSLYHTSIDYWASDSTWLSKVDNSRWLQYVQTVLTASSEIANSLLIGQTSVIVHDLSGRDFTPLLVSLVQLLVDPYYRTVIGLESLIQKEWVVKGHPFSQRLGPIKEATKSPKNMIFYRDEYVLDTNESPIFILFLDCVHQLLTQFPSRFGFTEQFLLLLIDGVYMCLFETFLFDTEYDRKKFNSHALESLWDFLATKIPPEKFKTLFLNQFYNIEKNTTQNSLQFMSESESLVQDLQLASSNELMTSFNINSISKSPRKSRKHRKANQAPPSIGKQYQSANDPNVFVINPDSSSIHVELWYEYFLRWAPTSDLSKGSSCGFSQYLQQMELLEEMKYLEDRLEHLRAKSIEMGSCGNSEESPTKHKQLTVRRSRKGLKKFTEESYDQLICHFMLCKLIHPAVDNTQL